MHRQRRNKKNASEPIWQPSADRIEASTLTRFIRYVSEETGLEFPDYQSLHRYSVEYAEDFWTYLIDYFDLRYEGSLIPANTEQGFARYGWFPQVELNFCENLLARGRDDDTALISLDERGVCNKLSYAQLRGNVATLVSEIHPHLKAGDVLACYMPNIAETTVAMLAATAVGAVFTSTSSDFGVEGVVDRFSQAEPQILVAAEGYWYNGKYINCLPKIAEVVSQVTSIKKVLIVPCQDITAGSGKQTAKGEEEAAKNQDINAGSEENTNAITQIRNAELWGIDYADAVTDVELKYVPRAFGDPLYIMYSSGTTGKPKCIVHSVGGTLLQHIKELALHTDLSANKSIYFFTTCGWMMWNWLMSSLYFGSTIVLYDGSPTYPDINTHLARIAEHQPHVFGTSPKFLRVCEDQNADWQPLANARLEVLLSTGSPLLPDQYDYVYERINNDILLSSISGGTDILGCFFCGNTISPVYKGEIQCAALGMDVVCADQDGQPLVGQQGELICRQSFPSRPLCFLNDEDDKLLQAAYFERFPGYWHHGDFIEITAHGGAIFYGRSDATLNPGGVRIGTSEIYRQTEKLSYIEDAVCVGKQIDGDVDIVLFVSMQDHETLNDERRTEIKRLIRERTTPRHVPKQIIAVTAIPYTRSGKKIESVVSNIINHKKVTNLQAVVNPECLEEYEHLI